MFGALLAPAALALLSTIFIDPAERGKAFGIFGAIAGGGAAVGLLLGGILTEWLSWRWCLYVNLLFARPDRASSALRLLHQPGATRTARRSTVPGTFTATAGLFALVYGFSNSETNSWGHPVTIIMLAAVGRAARPPSSVIESRVAHPLLPLRVIADRTRGGSYLAIGISGIALFAVFLFLTYYLQQTKGFTPIQTGLAFLPMTAAIMITATSVNIRLPQQGRPAPAAGRSAWCSARSRWSGSPRSPPTSSYVGHILPALVVMGVGHGQHLRPGVRDARPTASTRATAASPRRWSTRCSRSAARSAPPC